MKAPEPRVPEHLNLFAREVLDELKAHPESQGIILGGGVALQHYLDFRKTVDLDAWWAGSVDEGARSLIQAVIARVAGRRGLSSRTRRWGETESHEIVDGKRKVFCFQISRRDIQLDPPVPSHWPPVLLETFRDNLGAKMNALVERGARRDFVDVFEVCRRGLATVEECWLTWGAKNPGQSAREAKAKVLARLSAIEARRPLDRITDEGEKRASEEKADYMERVCAAFDYGVAPEERTLDLFSGWKDVFDRFPYRGSPAYHALRAFFGWEPVDRLPWFGIPYYLQLDRREEREDSCEKRV